MDGPIAGFLAVPAFLFLLLATVSIGRRLAGLLLPASEDGERTVLGFGLGMALLSLLTTALLFFRLPVLVVLGVVLLGGLAWARRDAAFCLTRSNGWLRGIASVPWPERLFRLLALAVAALGLVGCLAPETGWDAGTAHFLLPRLQAESGGLVARYDVSVSFKPNYMHSLYTIGFLSLGETFASLFNLAFYYAGLALVRVWSGRLGGGSAGLFAGFAYLGSVTFVLRTSGGDMDLGQALFLGIALFALGQLRTNDAMSLRLWAGLGLGMAQGIDNASGWAVAAIAAVWVVVRIMDKAPLGRIAMDGIVIGAVGLLLPLPWFLRNVLLEGNLFGPAYTPLVAGPLESGAVGSGSILLALRDLALNGGVLLALPAMWMAKGKGMRWLLGVAVLFHALLLRHTGLTDLGFANLFRWSSPSFPPLWVLAGVVLAASQARSKPVFRLGAAFLGLAALGALGVHGLRNGPKIPVAAGVELRDAYLGRRIAGYWAMRRAGKEVSEGKNVLLIEQRAYYCGAPFIAAPGEMGRIPYDEVEAASRFRGYLEENEIEWVVYSRYPGAGTDKFRVLLERIPSLAADVRMTAVETREDCVLYRVN